MAPSARRPVASEPGLAGPEEGRWAALAGPGHVVGVDIGGTLMKAVATGPDGRVVLRRRSPTPVTEGPEAVLRGALKLVEDLRADVRTKAADDVAGVGLAVPGIVDEARGVSRWAVNLGWRDLDVARVAAEALGLPVWLGHDVRLGGVAEGALGAGGGARDFLFVPVGTGIAAAVVLDGQARSGVDGLAGEIGHFVVAPGGPLCRCGAKGCLEALASASALARLYRERKAGTEAAVSSRSWPDAAGVLALARGGDPVAGEIWADAISHLGRALAAAQSLLDVELIVVGGGLANAGESLLRQIEAALSPLLPIQHVPRIALAQLGDEAAGLGAALLARSATPAHGSGP